MIERWQDNGANKDSLWCISAAGHLGGQESARWLCEDIDGQGWGTERAVRALNALVLLDSDLSLWPLLRRAFRGNKLDMRGRAHKALSELADKRGVPLPVLLDRAIPTLGFGTTGELTLDFGPRQFQVRVGPELTLLALSADKKRVQGRFPTKRKNDEPLLVKEAKKKWASLRKEMRVLREIVPAHLEQQMLHGRRWSWQEFNALLDHPILAPIVRRLVWVKDGGPRFIVLDGREYLGLSLETLSFTEHGTVGILHPASVPAREIEEWSTIFSDYELLQPITQLGREVFLLEPHECCTAVLKRFVGLKITAGGLDSLRASWTMGERGGPAHATRRIAGIVVTLRWDDDPSRCADRAKSTRLGGLSLEQPGMFGGLPPEQMSEMLRDIALAIVLAPSEDIA